MGDKKTNKNIACLLINALKQVMYGRRVRKNWRGIYFWVYAWPGHILETGLLGIKWKVWISSLIWYPIATVWSSVFSKVGHISEKLKSIWKGINLASGKNLIFDHKFSKCSENPKIYSHETNVKWTLIN